MRTTEPHYYDQREDLAARTVLAQTQILQHTPYPDFLARCFVFAEQHIFPLSQSPADLAATLATAKRFLRGQLSAAHLDAACQTATHNADRHQGKEHHIRLFAAFLLNHYFLTDTTEDEQQDDNIAIFLNLMFEIRKGICLQFVKFLTQPTGAT